MAYTKKRRYTKRRPMKKTVATKKPSYGFAKSVMQLVAEKKFIQNDNTGTFSNAAAQLSLLSTVGQGDTASQRSGNTISPTSWRCNISFNFNPASTQQWDVVRIIAFQWMEEVAGHAPTVDDVLQGSATGTPYGVLAVYSQTQKNNYRILYDKLRIIDYGSNRSGLVKINIPGHKLKNVHFSGGSDAQGHIYLLMLAQQSSGAVNNNIQFNYSSVMRFTDA